MTRISPQSDEELFRLYVGGNELAFEKLFQRYDDMLRRTMRKKIHSDRHAADDIVQQTWLNVWKERETFDGFDRPGRFRTWIFVIACRLAADFLKIRSRRLKRITSCSDLSDSNTEGWLIAIDGESPSSKIVSKEQRQSIARILCRLPEEPQACVREVVMRGATLPQAAARLGLSEKQVRLRVKFGLALLRVEIEGQDRSRAS